MRLYFYLIMIVLAVAHIRSQSPEFKHLTNADGLSENWVRQVIKDKNGYIWIATPEGLDRFDGYNIVNYRANPADSTSLVSNDIYTMKLLPDGSLLIGSGKGGVVKFDYDNQQFIRYDLVGDMGDHLSNQSVIDIEQDSLGRLYFATYDNGLFVYDSINNTTQQYKRDENNLNSLPNNWITLISPLADGSFLIGTLDFGLARVVLLADGEIEFHHYPATYSSSIYKVLCARSGEIWLGTGGRGVARLDNYLDTASVKFYSYSETNEQSISGNFVADIEEDLHGNIWVGVSGAGIDRYEPDIDGFKHYSNKRPLPNFYLSVFDLWDIHQDKAGDLWFGTGEDGVCRYNEKTDKMDVFQFAGVLEDGVLSSNKIRTIYEEDNGSLWFGTYSGGVNIYNKYNSFFATYKQVPGQPNSLSNSSIVSFEEVGDGTIWVGTDGGGINVFDPQTHKVLKTYEMDRDDPASLGADAVLKIYKDRRNTIWVGTWGGGLNKFNADSEGFKKYNTESGGNSMISNHVWQILEDRDGRIWIGTMMGGLHLYDEETDEFVRFYPWSMDNRMPEEDIWSMLEDSEGTIWVGGGRALVKVIEEKKGDFRFKVYYPDSENPCLNVQDEPVSALFEDSRNQLWVGIKGTGLCRFDKDEECFDCLTMEDGMKDTNVNGIVESGGYLWLSTNAGISRLNLDDLTFVHFYRSDGLQGNIFAHGACMKASDGTIYFGGANGMNVFDPSAIELDSTFSRIAFTDFKVYNKSVPIGTESGELPVYIDEMSRIRLTSDQEVFSIEYAAQNYVAPEKIEYAYMLEGFEEEWNLVGHSRVATYTNLDPGNYTFKVKSTNHSRLWSPDYRTLKIEIIPPFYQTFWFRLILALLVILIIYVVLHFRLRNIKSTQQLLEKRVQERTEKLTLEIEQRILTEVELSNALSELKDTQSRLVKSEKLASVGRFVAGIAHELNNPLNFIQGGLEMLKDVTTHNKGLDLIGEGFLRSSRIVKSLTSISFNNTHQLKFVLVDEIAQHALQSLQKLLPPENRVQITEKLGIHHPMQVYPEMLHTAIEKVLENAIYETSLMPIEERKISIKTSYCEDNSTFTIRIFNTGKNIPESIRSKIFDPFFTTKDPGVGTGLGLAIAYYFVKQHEGDIEAVNMKNGVEFVISMPAKMKEPTNE